MEYRSRGFWKLDQNSIWVGLENSVRSAFSEEQQSRLMEMESKSWWFVYRAGVIVDQMKRFFDPSKLTLDIGAGNGYTSTYACSHGFRVGIVEPTYAACVHAKSRGIEEVNCGIVTEQTIVDESLEQVILLDVMEHIEDDNGFMEILNRKLVRNGMILITVPAFMFLWSSNDVGAGHYRRYRKRELCKLLINRGFDICYRSYFMSFLVAPVFIFRVLLEKIGLRKNRTSMDREEREKLFHSEFRQRKGVIKAFLTFFERIERSFLRVGRSMPIGNSLIVIARKK